MVIGDADEYERQNFPRTQRKPRLSFDLSRGRPVPVIVDVTADEIEGEQLEQLRREAVLNDAFKAIFGHPLKGE